MPEISRTRLFLLTAAVAATGLILFGIGGEMVGVGRLGDGFAVMLLGMLLIVLAAIC
jgi:hypothetical protein